ncbi:MAG: hypothetical protein IK025_03045 [Bacteroidales bacterium]|nr:hypothetical protein [Bacteroidales bacterium]
MDFDVFDKKMRVYEESLDQIIVPETYMIARLDGRGFTKLTKEKCKFETPFDIRFRDMMVETLKKLMDCGFRIIYGFTESDEISLLFHIDEDSFARKVRKYNSILSGTASAFFSMRLGQIGVFDCRIIPLPNKELVVDYFLWRQEDANRNALNSHCYWMLRKQGVKPSAAQAQINRKTIADKNELLFSNGINYNDLPAWQKRGVGVWFVDEEKEGFNPLTKQKTIVTRRKLQANYDLPLGEEYGRLIGKIIDES